MSWVPILAQIDSRSDGSNRDRTVRPTRTDGQKAAGALYEAARSEGLGGADLAAVAKALEAPEQGEG